MNVFVIPAIVFHGIAGCVALLYVPCFMAAVTCSVRSILIVGKCQLRNSGSAGASGVGSITWALFYKHGATLWRNPESEW